MAIIDPPMVNKFMLVPEGNVFIGAQPGSALVIHKTASGSKAEDIAHFFANDPNKASSHFVIGQDGTIVQCVHLIDGSGANCCVETGYDSYWTPLVQQFGNLNRCTISIEHCDPTSDNSTPLTSAQKDSSFKLVKWLVDQYGFAHADIKGHNTIDPINRARCPGNYPWQELFDYLDTGGDVTIDLHNAEVAAHFEAAGNTWKCKQTGKILQGAILSFYQKFGNIDLCGLTFLGLPVSNEIALDVHGNVKQHYERGVLFYDPKHAYDNPPGSGNVYLAHIYEGPGQDPRVASLTATVADLQKQIADNPVNVALQQALDAANAKLAKVKADIA